MPTAWSRRCAGRASRRCRATWSRCCRRTGTLCWSPPSGTSSASPTGRFPAPCARPDRGAERCASRPGLGRGHGTAAVGTLGAVKDAGQDQDEPRWLTTEENEAWVALSWLMLKLPGAIEAQLQRDDGLTFFDYIVLAALSMAPDRSMRMSDLAEFANGSLSRLSNVAKRLEARGLLVRAPSPCNGRVTVAT